MVDRGEVEKRLYLRNICERPTKKDPETAVSPGEEKGVVWDGGERGRTHLPEGLQAHDHPSILRSQSNRAHPNQPDQYVMPLRLTRRCKSSDSRRDPSLPRSLPTPLPRLLRLLNPHHLEILDRPLPNLLGHPMDLRIGIGGAGGELGHVRACVAGAAVELRGERRVDVGGQGVSDMSGLGKRGVRACARIGRKYYCDGIESERKRQVSLMRSDASCSERLSARFGPVLV